MTTLNRRALLAAPALLVLPREAGAHHGFTGRYDMSRPVWLAGEVRRASFAPPHPTIVVAPEAGAAIAEPSRRPAELRGPITAWSGPAGIMPEVEFPPVQTFYRLGERLRVGDRVELIALRNCLPPHQLRSQWLRLSDGAIVEREGRLSYMVDACPQV